jgi:hypothetical protein
MRIYEDPETPLLLNRFESKSFHWITGEQARSPLRYKYPDNPWLILHGDRSTRRESLPTQRRVEDVRKSAL